MSNIANARAAGTRQLNGFEQPTSPVQQADLSAVLRPHLDRLYRLAFRLTGARADAEDLVQDVLVKVCARAEELTSIRDLSPWLGRVLYNQFIDDKRRYGRSPLKLVADESQDAPDHTTPSPEASAARYEHQVILQNTLRRLSEDQRVVLLLHDSEGYKLSEIQELTGTPVGTLKSRLHRARSRLAELLKKDGTFSPPPSCKGSEGAETDAL